MSVFITFEGIEGSGKTCQIKILNDFLRIRGRETLLTREPGGSPIGDAIRAILLDSQNAGMDATTELFLYEASRRQHVEHVIAPALEAKKVVLCDRFTDATVAYQGYGRGIDLDMIQKMNAQAIGGNFPKLTILLDCPVEIGLERARNRIEALHKKAKVRGEASSREDRFENEALEFHQRVRIGYLALADQEPERIIIVDSMEDIETVRQRIEDVVIRFL